MSKNISIVGIGMGNPDLLTKEVRCVLLEADLIIGARRMRDALPKNCKGEYHETYDGKEILSIIDQTPCENIVICMSGDSGFYSGTKGLVSVLEKKYETVNIMAGISSISYLSARSGISWQDACIVSLHGKKENWIQAVKTHEKTFMLLGGSLRGVVERLCLAGLTQCTLVIGIRLSYPDEKIIREKAETLLDRGDKLSGVDTSLCVLFILNDQAVCSTPSTGIPDDEFIRGQVPMTKSEVRAVTMSRLHLKENAVVYDIGAGTGSVSVEMAAQAWRGTVYAIECVPKALELLHANKEKFMADNLQITEGKAPEVFASLPAPDAVFIGGSKGERDGILEAVLQKNPQVHIVMNVISLESLTNILTLVKTYELENLEITQITAARGREIAGQHLMDGQNPVFVLSMDAKGR
ncbi:precorrin-6y C5,15-methyltransferase (decarboxylating) subunit CbiE [Lachnospiraceae bacterium JLR.KK008]